MKERKKKEEKQMTREEKNILENIMKLISSMTDDEFDDLAEFYDYEDDD